MNQAVSLPLWVFIALLCVALIERLAATGAQLYLPRADRDYAISVGMRMLLLRHLMHEEQGMFRANPSELQVLRYYAHAIAHLAPGNPVALADGAPR